MISKVHFISLNETENKAKYYNMASLLYRPTFTKNNCCKSSNISPGLLIFNWYPSLGVYLRETFIQSGLLLIYLHVYTYIKSKLLMYINKNIYIHMYIHTCIHSYIYTYIHTYIHTFISTYRPLRSSMRTSSVGIVDHGLLFEGVSYLC